MSIYLYAEEHRKTCIRLLLSEGVLLGVVGRRQLRKEGRKKKSCCIKRKQSHKCNMNVFLYGYASLEMFETVFLQGKNSYTEWILEVLHQRGKEKWEEQVRSCCGGL